ncbi:MAG TPA: GWxTD domain-containing protein [Acidobacteriota bacterium]
MPQQAAQRDPMSRTRRALRCWIALLGAASAAAAAAPATEPYDDAELEKLLERWRKELVVYLLEDDEKREFDALADNDARLEFMHRFWGARDPTPSTPENEFRDQHLQRFVYANRNFGAGRPGWRTDRGRLYILLGPPDEIQRNPTGRGPNERPSEVWVYNNPDDPLLPRELVFPFVDFFGVGDFDLVSGLDRTAQVKPYDTGTPAFSDLNAFAKRRQRQTYVDRRLASGRGGGGARGRDVGDLASDLFQTQIDLARAEKNARLVPLRELVITRHDFAELRFELSASAFRLGSSAYLPVTVALRYAELGREQVQGTEHYALSLLAQLLLQDGKVATELERRIQFSLDQREREQAGRPLLYQLPLQAAPGSYRLRAVVRDELGGAVGVQETALTISAPAFELTLSDLMLADEIAQLEQPPPADAGLLPFTFGRFRVVPNVAAAYPSGAALQVYFQVYGLALDPGRGTNEIEIVYEVLRNGKVTQSSPAQYPVPSRESERAVAGALRLQGYAPGSYLLRVTVRDRIAGASAAATRAFEVRAASS